MFGGSYSSTATSSPCSSTHSETANSQMESTLKEFVTSVAISTLPMTACVSPNAAKQLSPMLPETMDVDSVATEEGCLVIKEDEGEEEKGEGEQEATDEEGTEKQNRCVSSYGTLWFTMHLVFLKSYIWS